MSQDEKKYYAHESAYVDSPCEIGAGTKIWHYSHVMAGAKIGRNCTIGQNVFIAGEVVVGDNVKIQNNVSVYSGVEIEDYVFLGPSVVLTNIPNPRCEVVRQELYEKTLFRRGCTIGANATILCGVEIGYYAFVAAGSVVTRDVREYAKMMGVPAVQHGWMSRHGVPLTDPGADGVMVCPESGFRYKMIKDGHLRCMDLAEDEPLPKGQMQGYKSYKQFR